MSNKKITQLPSTDHVNEGDVLAIVQDGVTKQIDAKKVGGNGKLNIIDVLDSYGELESYDSPDVKPGAIIIVKDDETHNGATSFYEYSDRKPTNILRTAPDIPYAQVDGLMIVTTGVDEMGWGEEPEWSYDPETLRYTCTKGGRPGNQVCVYCSKPSKELVIRARTVTDNAKTMYIFGNASDSRDGWWGSQSTYQLTGQPTAGTSIDSEWKESRVLASSTWSSYIVSRAINRDHVEGEAIEIGVYYADDYDNSGTGWNFIKAYYDKDYVDGDFYTKSEIDSMIGDIDRLLTRLSTGEGV